VDLAPLVIGVVAGLAATYAGKNILITVQVVSTVLLVASLLIYPVNNQLAALLAEWGLGVNAGIATRAVTSYALPRRRTAHQQRRDRPHGHAD